MYLEGVVRDGVLQGNLYLRGQGDPRLGVEKLWQLMRRVQGLGIQRIEGDIVLDRSAFEVPWRDPGSFDGEPLRPYNATPDALLMCEKQRNGESEDWFSLWYHAASQQFVETPGGLPMDFDNAGSF